MTQEISNTQDIIDSRDIVERIEELEALEGAYNDAVSDDIEQGTEETKAARDSAATDFDDEEKAELKTLRDMVETIDGYGGDSAKDGVTLIRDDHFEDYARELAEEIGAVNKNATWPNNCINWEQAAIELQTDYTSCEYNGVTYWFR